MAHIHTEPGQHDHTISIYLFRTDFDEPKVMLHKHLKIGKLAQFGGHIELNETPWHSAIHELKEETGYDIHQTAILQPNTRLSTVGSATVHPYPVVHATMGYTTDAGHFHTDITYAFTADKPPIDDPAEGESTDIRLFTRNELVKLGEDVIDKITYDIALHIFDEIIDTWETVPTNTFK